MNATEELLRKQLSKFCVTLPADADEQELWSALKSVLDGMTGPQIMCCVGSDFQRLVNLGFLDEHIGDTEEIHLTSKPHEHE